MPVPVDHGPPKLSAGRYDQGRADAKDTYFPIRCEMVSLPSLDSSAFSAALDSCRGTRCDHQQIRPGRVFTQRLRASTVKTHPVQRVVVRKVDVVQHEAAKDRVLGKGERGCGLHPLHVQEHRRDHPEEDAKPWYPE